MSEWVYFAADVGRIKIGYSRNVASRIDDIGQYLEKPLDMLGMIPGGLNVERAIHTHLAEYRLRGEWFKDDPHVRQCISAILSDGLKAANITIGPYISIRSVKRDAPENKLPILCRMMWPDDAIVELMALSGEPELICRSWMTDRAEFPLLIRLALAALIVTWINGKPISVRDMLANEWRAA